MVALARFIRDENRWNKLFQKPMLTTPTNKEECQPLFQILECRLSPENLHCDGEISMSAARRKYKELMNVWDALENIQGEPRQVNV